MSPESFGSRKSPDRWVGRVAVGAVLEEDPFIIEVTQDIADGRAAIAENESLLSEIEQLDADLYRHHRLIIDGFIDPPDPSAQPTPTVFKRRRGRA